MTLFALENLNLSLSHNREKVPILKDVSFDLKKQEIFGVVGESGSGKTMLMRFILGLAPKTSEFSFGRFFFDGAEFFSQSYSVAGKSMAMILQDPKTSLNPVLTVEKQLKEAFVLSGQQGDLKERILESLREVSISDPERTSKSYPFELSGGMGQRVMIAMMLALKPKILIADEPTSSLDVHVQRQILDLLKQKAREHSMTLVIVSHDLSLVSSYCDRVMVMRNGFIVDMCLASALNQSKNPYTKGLFECLPRLNEKRKRLPVLSREDFNDLC